MRQRRVGDTSGMRALLPRFRGSYYCDISYKVKFSLGQKRSKKVGKFNSIKYDYVSCSDYLLENTRADAI